MIILLSVQRLSYLFIYELLVLEALQADSLTHQDISLIPRLHQKGSLTDQDASLTYQTRLKASSIHQDHPSYQTPSLIHQTHQASILTKHDERLINQPYQLPSLIHQASPIYHPKTLPSLTRQQQASISTKDAKSSSHIHQSYPAPPQTASLTYQSDRTASLTHQVLKSGHFSMASIMESITLPPLPAVFTGGATKCQALKSLFGLTYEQMLEKNSSKFYESLTIDLITKDGNEKYNFTSTKRLAHILKDAKEIIVLAHGFLESSDGAMVQALAMEFLKKSGLEILALDGRKVINLEYFRSTTYVRFMGEKLGHVLSDLIKEDIDPSKFTLIGHSLGAHIAGIAGSRIHQLVGKPVGRVIGLDPAGPCFANVSADNRLDKTNAEYVEVIHTNAGILGINEAIGHKDFYPSGGKSQPGCLLSTCDHSRAWQIFAEAVNAPDHFPARKCSNWTAFKDGLCAKNEVSYMGASSKDSPGLYYLNVASAPPYGLGPTGSG